MSILFERERLMRSVALERAEFSLGKDAIEFMEPPKTSRNGYDPIFRQSVRQSLV
jgi:hypothetical protein